MKDPFGRPLIRTGAFYQDPEMALDWIEAAFGLTRIVEVRDAVGQLVHAEMQYGDCSIVIDGEWADFVSSPNSLEGKNTQIIYVQLDRGLDEHCENARVQGAEIISEPEDQYYGDRLYRAKDFEGHIWTFSQTIKRVDRNEAERLGNVKIAGWHE